MFVAFTITDMDTTYSTGSYQNCRLNYKDHGYLLNCTIKWLRYLVAVGGANG